jgi:hypothetical protein
MTYLTNIPAVQKLLKNADHYDEKVVEGDVTLHQFIAGCLTYYPTWIKALYGVRAGFVRLLGMKQEKMPVPRLTAATVPFEAGKMATFFKVEDSTSETLWIASATDTHLTAYLVIAAEPLSEQKNRFYVGTIVHYHKWTGPVYFNVIRPFHHIVVQSMMNAGVRQ